MEIVSLLLIAVSLSMDAFAVAVCKGLAMKKLTWRGMLTVSAWFGAFQALMPLIGYYLGRVFERQIQAVDHWISFALLLLIGLNMIREAFSREEEPACASLAPSVMVLLALATSIDALAVGVVFALSGSLNIWLSALIIGVAAFLLSAVGVRVGNLFGARHKSRAEFVGGVILVLLGVKILLEDLGVLTIPI